MTKIIQITAIPSSAWNWENKSLYALCDDGSILVLYDDEWEWSKLPPLPPQP